MVLLSEMQHHGFGIAKVKAQLHRKVFEDNSGAVKMIHIHNRPQPNHHNPKLHHFHSYVNSNRISIHAIESGKQLADYLTKPLNAQTLAHHRQQVLGW